MMLLLCLVLAFVAFAVSLISLVRAIEVNKYLCSMANDLEEQRETW
jgi:hypothetical protein